MSEQTRRESCDDFSLPENKNKGEIEMENPREKVAKFCVCKECPRALITSTGPQRVNVFCREMMQEVSTFIEQCSFREEGTK